MALRADSRETTWRLKDYGRMVRDGWVLILIATLLSMGAAWGGTHFQEKKFVAQSTVLVVTPGQASPVAFASSLNSLLRVQTYVTLGGSTQVLGRAIGVLNNGDTIASLTKKLTLTAGTGSSLITVTGTDSTAVGAQNVANAAAGSLVQVANELESTGNIEASGLVLIDTATLPPSRERATLIANIELGAVVGVLVGMLLTVVSGLRDGSMRYRDEVGLILREQDESGAHV